MNNKQTNSTDASAVGEPQVGDLPAAPAPMAPTVSSGVHAVQSIRAHMRARETMLRKECDRLDAERAPLDALAKKMIADELDRYCQMLNRLEYDYSQNTEGQPHLTD